MAVNTLSLDISMNLTDGVDGTTNVFESAIAGTKSSISEYTRKKFNIANAVIDEQLNLDNVDQANLIILKVSKAMSVKIGGVEADRKVEIPTNLQDANNADFGILVLTSNATAIYVSNESGENGVIEVTIL